MGVVKANHWFLPSQWRQLLRACYNPQASVNLHASSPPNRTSCQAQLLFREVGRWVEGMLAHVCTCKTKPNAKRPIFFFLRDWPKIFLCSHRGVWRLKATKGLQSNYLFSRTKTRAGQGVCSGISLSCLLLFLLCVTGLISKFRHFFLQFFLFLLPLGSFVI